MCMAGEILHALLPADTQLPQQQLETQFAIEPERIAYKSLGQQSKKSKLLQPIKQVDAHILSRQRKCRAGLHQN